MVFLLPTGRRGKTGYELGQGDDHRNRYLSIHKMRRIVQKGMFWMTPGTWLKSVLDKQKKGPPWRREINANEKCVRLFFYFGGGEFQIPFCSTAVCLSLWIAVFMKFISFRPVPLSLSRLLVLFRYSLLWYRRFYDWSKKITENGGGVRQRGTINKWSSWRLPSSQRTKATKWATNLLTKNLFALFFCSERRAETEADSAWHQKINLLRNYPCKRSDTKNERKILLR